MCLQPGNEDSSSESSESVQSEVTEEPEYTPEELEAMAAYNKTKEEAERVREAYDKEQEELMLANQHRNHGTKDDFELEDDLRRIECLQFLAVMRAAGFEDEVGWLVVWSIHYSIFTILC